MNRLNFSKSALALLGLALLANAAFANTKLEEIAIKASEQYYREYNAARTFAILTGIPMSVQSPSGTLFLRGVRDGRPIYWTYKDRVGAITVSSDKVWPGGSAGMSLNGAGVPMGIWDDGIPNHPELAGRIISGDGGGVGDHGLSVASNMAATGLNPNAKGMSFALGFSQIGRAHV